MLTSELKFISHYILPSLKRLKVGSKPFIDMMTINMINFFLDMVEIKKVLTKLSKEKGCEVIGRWRKACVRQFYWAATSTQPKLGDVVLAKFNAFLSHVINKHNDLPNKLFNKCAHGDITNPRVWLTKGKCFH